MNDATACLIAKDEAPYMVEWLGHYLRLGFERIEVYDNGSTDGTAAIVRACARQFPGVEYRPWPDRPGSAPQLSAYANALARCRTEWIGFFDADELLVLKEHASVGAFLDRYPGNAGSVAINWLMFGSGGETDYRDELQSARFRLVGRLQDLVEEAFGRCLSQLEATMNDRARTEA